MSSMRTITIKRQSVTIGRGQDILWSEDQGEAVPVVKVPVRGRLLDTSTKCLLALGSAPVIVGIATGIWPVALAGLGPLLLAWLDTNRRR